MLATYITKEENTTFIIFIIVLMLLNRMALTLYFHFNRYETDSCLLISWKILPLHIADISK